MTLHDAAEARRAMVREQIAARGIRDPRVLRAMREVPREAFVDPDLAEAAFDDGPLPIGAGQTISQPYVVALMAEVLQLRGGERVLEVGTGSGYAAAVLSRMAKRVYSVERIPELAAGASRRLQALGFDNVATLQGDGTLGWAEQAPFDAIMVTASGPRVPQALKDQLAVGGRLVMPVGDATEGQELVCVKRVAPSRFATQRLGGVRFVPLIGTQGWPAAD